MTTTKTTQQERQQQLCHCLNIHLNDIFDAPGHELPDHLNNIESLHSFIKFVTRDDLSAGDMTRATDLLRRHISIDPRPRWLRWVPRHYFDFWQPQPKRLTSQNQLLQALDVQHQQGGK
jgi:hypothetical protein